MRNYAYNGLGHRSSITYPDNDTVTFVPNGFGEPTQAVRTRGSEAAYNYATGASWYPNGAINTFTYGNGLTHKTELNLRKLPGSVRDYKDAFKALHYSYEYDNNMNITVLRDRANKDANDVELFSLTNLTYDGLDRLTGTTGGSGIGSSTLTYDGLGNITRYHSKGRNLTYSYNYSQNRLTGVNDSIGTKDYAFFSYDDRGNITNTSFNGLTFNRANQVTAATTTTGSSNTFVYDGHNRRVKKTSSNGIEYSFYGQDGTLLYRENQANGGGINYIYLGKKLIAKDGFIPEDSGQQHYRPYGDSIEGAADDVGYTGHKFDKDLGLSYMQARYYDPVIGRFYSNDPVDAATFLSQGNVQGFGRYTYVNNNPYKYIDPDGKTGILISPKLTPRISPVAQGVRNGFQQNATNRQAAGRNMQRQTDAIIRNGNNVAKNSKGETRQPSLKEAPKQPAETTRGRIIEGIKQVVKNLDDFAGSVAGAAVGGSDSSSEGNQMSDDTKKVVAEAQIRMTPVEPPSNIAKDKEV